MTEQQHLFCFYEYIFFSASVQITFSSPAGLDRRWIYCWGVSLKSVVNEAWQVKASHENMESKEAPKSPNMLYLPDSLSLITISNKPEPQIDSAPHLVSLVTALFGAVRDDGRSSTSQQCGADSFPGRKCYWSTVVFIDRTKHPVYHLQTLMENHAGFILPVYVFYLWRNGAFQINFRTHTGLKGVDVWWTWHHHIPAIPSDPEEKCSLTEVRSALYRTSRPICSF